MKKLKSILSAVALLMLAMVFLSAHFMHETHITIISPKAETTYKTGQIVNIHFKLRCGEKLRSVEYRLTDQNDNVLMVKKPNVMGKTAIEEKSSWKIIQTDPSVLTLFIEATDADGHTSNKVIQFNVNL
jgi:hypothetical protein